MGGAIWFNWDRSLKGIKMSEFNYNCKWCDDIGWCLELVSIERTARVVNLPCRCSKGDEMMESVQNIGYHHSFHGKFPHGQIDFDSKGEFSYNDCVMVEYHQLIVQQRAKRLELIEEGIQ